MKERAYGGQGDDAARSAKAALARALSVLLRLFAPVLPFATEEVWSWWLRRVGAPLLLADGGRARCSAGDPRVLDAVALALRDIRKAKSEAKLSMKTDVAVATCPGPTCTSRGCAPAPPTWPAPAGCSGSSTTRPAAGDPSVSVQLD